MPTAKAITKAIARPQKNQGMFELEVVYGIISSPCIMYYPVVQNGA